MNISALAGTAAPTTAPQAASPAPADTGDDAHFARLLHQATGPKEAARPPAKPPARSDAKAEGADKTAAAPRKPAASATPPDDASTARARAEGATEGDTADAARSGSEGDPTALLASLLGATPRPPALPAAAARGAADATSTSAITAKAAARAMADGDTGRSAAGAALPDRWGDRLAAAEDAANARTHADAPPFVLPTLAGAHGGTPPPAADAATTGADPRIAAPVHSAEFAPALGAQVSLLVKEGVQEARLQLNPAELGPITVQIQLDGQNAQVVMAAEQPATRERLEQALPALAGALQDNGLTLTGGGVFEQPRQSQSQPQAAPSAAGRWSGGDAEDDGPAAVAAPVRRVATPGGVDLYA